jgi:hypothetical protein
LPVCSKISVWNIVISLTGLAVIWSSKWLGTAIQSRPPRSKGFMTSYSHVIILLPFALAILSIAYMNQSDLRDCLAEMQWEHLFQKKNEAAIRSIQEQLHCCGFNSMRDRAWPFPSRNIVANTCETTSGYQTFCGPLLKEKVMQAAMSSGFASASNVVLLVRTCVRSIG